MTVTQTVIEKIKTLCRLFAPVEWSGLIWMEIQGSVEDPSNMHIKVTDFTLLDIGSGAYTEFEVDPVIMMGIYDKNPDYITKKYGLMHSHNNMGVFFSGTDTDTLMEQAFIHNFFVSLIVNNRLDKIAKISYKGEKETVHTYFNRIGQIAMPFTRVEKEDVVYAIDVDVEYEASIIDTDLQEQIDRCREKVREKEELAKQAKELQLQYDKDYPTYYTGGFQPSIFPNVPRRDFIDDWDDKPVHNQIPIVFNPKKNDHLDKLNQKFESSVSTFKDKCETLIKRLFITDYTGDLVFGLTLDGARNLHKEDYIETPLSVYIEEIDEMCETLIPEIFNLELTKNWGDDVNFKKVRDMISSQCQVYLNLHDETERAIFESIDQELKRLDNVRANQN